ncbi:MAG: branched-chain amino acid ABC transporter permease [Actinobacteria bacterium]|nr:branched-chain amino acid ABC transporter permease [Actinomycetota bacterium]
MDFGLILDRFLEAALGTDAVYFAVAAIGLNLHFGYTGLLNFGHIGFLMVGAYGVAITVTFFGLSFWAGLVVGILASIVYALLLGLPTLRLRADYLAIVTIVAAEIMRFLFRAVTFREVTGGSFGLQGFARDFYAINPYPPATYALGPIDFSERQMWLLTVGWTLAALLAVGLWLLARSPWGRVLKAIREDEDAARSLGKNVFGYKMQSLVLGGVMGGFGGFILATSQQAVQPDTYSPPVTFFIFTALILGGAATVIGPIIGSMLFWALLSATDAFLRQGVSSGVIPSWLMDGVQVGAVRFMLVGLGLMLLMIFRPQGIFGDRRELALER